MKYVIGSLMISFGVHLVLVMMLMSLRITAPDNVIEYLGLSWALVAVFAYPLAKKWVR